MKTKFISVSLLLVMTIISISNAQSTKERLQSYIESYHKQGTFNGTILVAQKGQVILSEGYGYANMEHGIKNTPSTKFLLASVSKVFTATTIMKLVDQGKISLNTKLSEVLVWYRNDSGNKITIEHLLNHTSGIPNYLDMRGKSIYDVANIFGTAPINKVEFAQKNCQGDLEFEPGTKWNYNNSAYFLLGLIIEQITGMPYNNALNAYIFDSLNMSNTGDIQPNPTQIIPNLASGYMQFFTDYSHMPYWNLSTTYGAGSLYSTVEDLLKFDRALYDENFISQTARNAMFTSNLNNYGCGWEIKEIPIGTDKAIKKIRMHQGYLFAWHTRFYQIPDDEYLIVILNNAGAVPLDEMIGGITGILYNRSVENVKPLVAFDLWKSYKEGKADQRLSFFQSCSPSEKVKWDFNEYHLNGLGYTLLPLDKGLSMKVFRFVTEVYPKSWNAWDSYGESLAISGLKEEAIKAYEKSLEYNPENQGAIQMLNKLRVEP